MQYGLTIMNKNLKYSLMSLTGILLMVIAAGAFDSDTDYDDEVMAESYEVNEQYDEYPLDIVSEVDEQPDIDSGYDMDEVVVVEEPYATDEVVVVEEPYDTDEQYGEYPLNTVSADDAMIAVVHERCTTCHAAQPTQAGFAAPPAGIILQTPEDMKTHKDKIVVAVQSGYMPLGNITKITDEERQKVVSYTSNL